MPSKRNPLNLNPLQLKTLTLLQELAQVAGKPVAEDEPGGVAITELPNPHGDHFHLGEAIVAARDATGLRKTSGWAPLQPNRPPTPNLPEPPLTTPAPPQHQPHLP